jgi:hypothetical protein
MVFIDDTGAHLSWIRSMCPETRIRANGRYQYPRYTIEFMKQFYDENIMMPKK